MKTCWGPPLPPRVTGSGGALGTERPLPVTAGQRPHACARTHTRTRARTHTHTHTVSDLASCHITTYTYTHVCTHREPALTELTFFLHSGNGEHRHKATRSPAFLQLFTFQTVLVLPVLTHARFIPGVDHPQFSGVGFKRDWLEIWRFPTFFFFFLKLIIINKVSKVAIETHS